MKWKKHERGRYRGEKRLEEDGWAKARNEKTMRESGRQTPWNSREMWRKIETCERSDFWAVHHGQGRDGWEVNESGEGPYSQHWEWLKRSQTQWWKWFRRLYSRTAAARRKEKRPDVGNTYRKLYSSSMQGFMVNQRKTVPLSSSCQIKTRESQDWKAEVMRRLLWIWTRKTQRRWRKDREKLKTTNEERQKWEESWEWRGFCDSMRCVRLYSGAARHVRRLAGAPI